MSDPEGESTAAETGAEAGVETVVNEEPDTGTDNTEVTEAASDKPPP